MCPSPFSDCSFKHACVQVSTGRERSTIWEHDYPRWLVESQEVETEWDIDEQIEEDVSHVEDLGSKNVPYWPQSTLESVKHEVSWGFIDLDDCCDICRPQTRQSNSLSRCKSAFLSWFDFQERAS
mmetsp:Transcript_1338/g.2734  ORF Transcript_1338/g.2734 Transcript_1338/m.2734 type:complete len:125 (-) Transcript_1338:446-820(-)